VHLVIFAEKPVAALSTILLDYAMQLSKLLLTGYQFSRVRIPIECVVVVLLVFD